MDLSRDNQKIYSIEAEYYKEYMDEGDQKAISSRLNSVIKLLLALLLAILAYFAYKIIDGNLVIDDVINKKNIMSTFSSPDKEAYVEELADEKVETVEKNVAIAEESNIVENSKKEVEKKEPIIQEEIVKVEKKVMDVPSVSKIEVVEHTPVAPLPVIKESEPIVAPVETKGKISSNLDTSEDLLISDEYLDAMMSEMNK